MTITISVQILPAVVSGKKKVSPSSFPSVLLFLLSERFESLDTAEVEAMYQVVTIVVGILFVVSVVSETNQSPFIEID